MDIPGCPISKNKQLVDIKIGMDSIPSKGGSFFSPYQTVISCLLHWNGYIQAMNAGSPDVHINLQYKKWTVGAEKMPTKHNYLNSHIFQSFCINIGYHYKCN